MLINYKKIIMIAIAMNTFYLILISVLIMNVHMIAEPDAKRFKDNYATLESINEDCLPIFRYINIIEVVNLAGTCTRLRDFAYNSIIPKMARQVKLRITDGYTAEQYNMNYLEEPFGIFGKFVEQLTLTR